HQLIKAKTRQRSADPDVKKQKATDLNQKPERANKAEHERATRQKSVDERHVPATQKQSSGQHRNREHVDVLGEKEERKFHRAVLGMKTSDEFGLGFRKIKRNAIRLSDRGNKVENKA